VFNANYAKLQLYFNDYFFVVHNRKRNEPYYHIRDRKQQKSRLSFKPFGDLLEKNIDMPP